LQHLNGGDQRGAGEVFEGSVLGDAYCLDVETFRLHRAEQLLNRPARAIKAGDPFRITATFRQRDGHTMHVRKATVAEPALRRIYEALGIDASLGGVQKLMA